MLPFSRRTRVLLAAATLPFVLSACGPSAAEGQHGDRDPDELVFASIPSEDSGDLEQDYEPLIRMLERETGKKVRMQKATDYAAVIEGQRTGKVDIALYGPLSYVVAERNGAEITPVAAQTEERGQDPTYRSYGVVPADSPVQDLSGFRDRQVCFVDPNSTSGYLYPKAALLDAGIDPERGVQPVMAGGHDASALSVHGGQCGAGFAQDVMVDELLPERGGLAREDLRVVWKSDPIPGSPLAVSDDLAPQLREKISGALRDKANADYLRENGFCAGDCRTGGYWGFVPVDDHTFDSVRDVCATTRDEQCTTG
ncbi:phosphate/phosphite/phosphonate ABC transporter substrate-binding protein [Saccharopolyspora sp. HNM0983]|uniref:Phosphate/phosphite/phosphonate ABC transporter substrate-binding protein n=1 Tax=Saccharopolyspora montiporae TaxID=2781240 RepID=A0A929BDV3_9PSEU|nr:phosphate/phosphite/phosphonate ABC transporter substrate-binding protein [Saccharopolyspora sp. HNM0983]MBE9376540.1 phosphate/phosphite/phosphonate ABC transporter substrate-binding protein [Saccharopolyspora sp. HNM0983]